MSLNASELLRADLAASASFTFLAHPKGSALEAAGLEIADKDD